MKVMLGEIKRFKGLIKTGVTVDQDRGAHEEASKSVCVHRTTQVHEGHATNERV